MLGRVRKVGIVQHRLALGFTYMKTVSGKPRPRIPCVSEGASSFLHTAGKGGVGKSGEQTSRSKGLHWLWK